MAVVAGHRASTLPMLSDRPRMAATMCIWGSSCGPCLSEHQLGYVKLGEHVFYLGPTPAWVRGVLVSLLPGMFPTSQSWVSGGCTVPAWTDCSTCLSLWTHSSMPHMSSSHQMCHPQTRHSQWPSQWSMIHRQKRHNWEAVSLWSFVIFMWTENKQQCPTATDSCKGEPIICNHLQ